MASHEDGGVVTGHIGTNTHPNLYPLAGDDRALTLLKRCRADSGGLELAEIKSQKNIFIKSDLKTRQIQKENTCFSAQHPMH